MDDHGLKQRIFDHPDDREALAVYADVLLQQGDPRGELIQFELALEDPSRSPEDRAQLTHEREALIDTHGRAWVGPLAPFLFDHQPKHRYHSGYLHQFKNGYLYSIDAHELEAEFIEALVTSPETPDLTRLRLLYVGYEEEEVLTGLGKAPLRNLRFFQLGDDDDQCHTSGETVMEAVSAMPRIEHLHFYAHRIDTEDLFSRDLPHLKSLYAHHGYSFPVERLAANPSLKNLEAISFFPHALEPDDDEAYLRLEHIEAIAASTQLPNLRRLEFRICSMGDAGIEAICRSDLLERLEVLDLTYGEITDHGAKQLAATPAARTLRRLVLDYNQLTAEGITALEALELPELSAQEQFSDLEDDGLPEYLWHGDIE